jgi:hypothetical protein
MFGESSENKEASTSALSLYLLNILHILELMVPGILLHQTGHQDACASVVT